MNKRLPAIGARIIKSALGVAICMLLYFIRGQQGMPYYSAQAMLLCMQPYADTAKNAAKERVSGSLIGAAFGLVFLLCMRSVEDPERLWVYLAASVIIIPIIYTTVLINKRESAFFTCCMFLSIAVTHGFDENPYMFVFNRLIDTFIGITVGLFMQNMHIRGKKDKNTVFICGIDSVLVDDSGDIPPYSRVELNRLISEGVLFTVATSHTPASVLNIMKGIELNVPVIAMDGAVLYDTRENIYLETVMLDSETSAECERIISDEGLGCFVNVLFDNTLLTYYGELVNEAEKEIYAGLRRSPYRNYTHSSFRYTAAEKGRVIYLMTVAENDRIDKLCDRLKNSSVSENTRITVVPEKGFEGHKRLRIYSADATRKAMMKRLLDYTHGERMITLGTDPEGSDVHIKNGIAAVREIKRLYEGVGKRKK